MGFASFGTGFTVGFGAGLLARETVPVLKRVARPMTRVMVKSAIQLSEKSREALARVGETLEDIVAEVRGELKRDYRKLHKRAVARKAKAQHRAEGAKVTPLRKEAA